MVEPGEGEGDRDAVLTAVRRDGLALQFASEAHRRDREIVLAAVRRDGRALAFSFFPNDRDVVLEAVRTSGAALGLASVRLRHDHGVVLTAVFHHHEAARHALVHGRLDLRRAGPVHARILLTYAAGPFALPPDVVERIVAYVGSNATDVPRPCL